MNRTRIRALVVLGVLLVVSLVAIQMVWVNKAYKLQNQEFEDKVIAALHQVTQEIMLHNNDSSVVMNPVSVEQNGKLYKVSVSYPLTDYYLKTLLVRNFQERGIQVAFEYNIYDCFTDSVVAQGALDLEQDEVEPTKIPSADILYTNDSHNFSVFFPNLTVSLISEMGFWVYSSIMVLILVLFFVYSISTILQQKRLSELKTDFINNLTHEFKTPISTIQLSAKSLQNATEPFNIDRIKNYAQIILSENSRLKEQVEKVLQIATLEKQRLNLSLQQVDLVEIVNHACKSMDLAIQKANATIHLNSSSKSTLILGDEAHLTNVFCNLIDNALKYCTQKPEISIAFTNRNHQIFVSFSDNGIGISKEHQKFIFEKLFRVPTGNKHDVKGFGIGLFYVKQIILAHKAKIEVQSELNQGTTFNLTFTPNSTHK